MKTLVIVAHPNLIESKVNKHWINKLSEFPELYTVHNLYAEYSNWEINVSKEQALVEEHDNIVFQFPVYWFSCPPLLKKWLDDVLAYGWAYGSSSGYKLQGKKVTVAVSAGIHQKDYTEDGRYLYTLDELFRPFEVTANYIKATWVPFFSYYGTEFLPDDDLSLITEIETSGDKYLSYLATTMK